MNVLVIRLLALALVGVSVLAEARVQGKQPSPIRVRGSTVTTEEGFRVAIVGETDFPEGTFLDVALSRRPALQIDDRFYQPLQIFQTALVDKNGDFAMTMDVPESFVLPGRYDLAITFLPEKQSQNTGKLMAENDLPMKECSARASVILNDPERFKSVMTNDLEDFVKISATLRDINRIIASATPEKSADEKVRAQLFKGMDLLAEAMHRSDNRSYFPHVRSEVALYISYIPKLKFVTTAKPDYVKEEEEALEKHNRKMLEEGKENAVVKLPEERVILEETTEKILIFFLCSYASGILDVAGSAADALKEAAEGRLLWKTVEEEAKKEIAASKDITEEFDKSAFGEASRALFRADDKPLLTRAVDEIAAIHAEMNEAIRSKGSLPDVDALRERFAVVAGLRKAFRKIVDERLAKYRSTHDAEKTPPPESPTPGNAPLK